MTSGMDLSTTIQNTKLARIYKDQEETASWQRSDFLTVEGMSKMGLTF